jgi:serine/threonine protein kinase
MRNVDRKVWILQGYYQIIKILEELDYSTVYLGKDVEEGVEEYAIKEVKIHFETKENLKKALRYFEKIVISYTDIYHPYLVNIKDFFLQDECEYIVMPFIPGRRLQEIIDVKNEPFAENDIVDIGIMIASALSYLHSKNPPVFFSDLFPSNIIINPRGALQLTDYGLGKILARRPPDAPLRGTKGYAPPEQCTANASIDSKTDIYQLGALLHQLATIKHPLSFSGRLPPVRQINHKISKRLEETIYKATDYDRKIRHRSASHLLSELTGSKEEKPQKSQMKLWLNRILNRRKFEI